ncbi:MAG: hypothetical protein R3F20_19310 [Planctomycetota bacterium]
MSRTRPTTLALAAAVLALAAAAPAQVLFSGNQINPPGLFEMDYLPTAAYPVGGPGIPPLGLPFPNAALMPPAPAIGLVGGMASDDRNAWIYTTNGFLITMDMNPNYLPFGFTAPPPLAGPAPIPSPYPPTVALQVSGIAYDDAAGILWACDAFNFWPMNPLPPFNPIGLPVPIPGIGPPATGLGFEPSSGTLWACDAQGGIYHFTPAGAPIGPQPVSIVAGLVGPLGGLTVAPHNGPPAILPPACSTQIPGYHVSVTDGLMIYDAFNAAPPIPHVFPAPGAAFGLTYSADPQVTYCASPTAVGCTTGFAPFTGLQRPAVTGPGLFNGIRLVGAQPLTPAFLLIDICPAPTCWLGLMMNPFTWISLPFTTDAAGNAGIGFFIGGFPPGFQFSHQWAVQDPGAPLGYCFSNVSTQTVALP